MDETNQAPGTVPVAGPRQRLDDSLVLLGSVSTALVAVLEAVRAGRRGALRDVLVKQSEVEAALRHALETERRFNDWQAGQEAAARGGVADIDFDAARYDIGCRLSRLRECCATE